VRAHSGAHARRADHGGSRARRAPARRATRLAVGVAVACALAAALTGSVPGARDEPERRAVAVERPAVRAGAAARAEVLALADAALADAAATARAAPADAPADLLAALDAAAARLRSFATPGGRGPLSPPPGTAVRLSQIEAAVGDVFRAAAAVRAAAGPASSTVAVGWTAPPGLARLEAAVADARAAAAAVRRPDAPAVDGSAGWVDRRHPAVDEADLCPVPFAPTHRLRCDAAAALAALNDAYRAEHGADLELSSAYRTHTQQVALRAARGALAARPGTSLHERGVAVDLAGAGGLGEFDAPLYRWLAATAPRFGWAHPPALGPGGSGPPEPWHWEFVG